MPTTNNSSDKLNTHPCNHLLYPVFQRHLVVLKLLFLWTFTEMLEGKNEHTCHINFLVCVEHKQILAKELLTIALENSLLCTISDSASQQ